MEIPGRAEKDRLFAEKLRALSDKRRAELKRLLGYPPNLANVPGSFWIAVARDAEEEAAAAIFLMYLATAEWHAGESGMADDLGLDMLELRATAYGESAARELGQKMAAGAQAQLSSSMATIEQALAADTLTRKEILELLEAELKKVLGDARADRLAQSANTAAQTAGGDAGMEETAGISPEDRWSVHPELSKSGPCENCQALDQQPRRLWGSIPLPFPDEAQYDPAGGPLLHDGCCCDIEYANLPATVRA